MKLNKLALLLAAFLMVAACGEKNDPITPDKDKDNQENVTPTPEPEPAELVLTFDFTNAEAMAGWPTALEPYGASSDTQFTCPYVLDGVTYNFISAQPLNVSKNQWPYFNESEAAVVFPKERYIGFPVVEGRKLSKVTITLQATTAAAYMISAEIAEGATKPNPIAGGEEQTDEAATEFTFTLTETQVATQYWIKVYNKAPRLTGIQLTYSK